jgi:hypothetical protein
MAQEPTLAAMFLQMSNMLVASEKRHAESMAMMQKQIDALVAGRSDNVNTGQVDSNAAKNGRVAFDSLASHQKQI